MCLLPGRGRCGAGVADPGELLWGPEEGLSAWWIYFSLHALLFGPELRCNIIKFTVIKSKRGAVASFFFTAAGVPGSGLRAGAAVTPLRVCRCVRTRRDL